MSPSTLARTPLLPALDPNLNPSGSVYEMDQRRAEQSSVRMLSVVIERGDGGQNRIRELFDLIRSGDISASNRHCTVSQDAAAQEG